MGIKHLCMASLLLVVASNLNVYSADIVDTQLVFINDTSGSMSDDHMSEERESIRAAMRSTDVINTIEGNFNQTGAVQYIEFSTAPIVVVDWTLLKTQQQIVAWTNLIPESTRPAGAGATWTHDAYKKAIESLQNPNIKSTQQTIFLITDSVPDMGYSFKSKYQALTESLPVTTSVVVLYIHAPSGADRDGMQLFFTETMLHGSKGVVVPFSIEMLQYHVLRAFQIDGY